LLGYGARLAYGCNIGVFQRRCLGRAVGVARRGAAGTLIGVRLRPLLGSPTKRRQRRTDARPRGAVRLAAFIGVLALMLGWEILSPAGHCRFMPARLLRYGRNVGMAVLGTLLLRLDFPVLAVGFAELMAARSLVC
jgi:hypothetical protein